MNVYEHPSAFGLHQVWPAYLSVLRHPTLNPDLRGVDDESVPLALDVVVRRLLGDIKTIKFNLPGDLLLPLKDHHGNLRRWSFHMSAPAIITCEAWAEGPLCCRDNADLQTVVADQAQQRYDGVEHSQEAQGG